MEEFDERVHKPIREGILEYEDSVLKFDTMKRDTSFGLWIGQFVLLLITWYNLFQSIFHRSSSTPKFLSFGIIMSKLKKTMVKILEVVRFASDWIEYLILLSSFTDSGS